MTEGAAACVVVEVVVVCGWLDSLFFVLFRYTKTDAHHLHIEPVVVVLVVVVVVVLVVVLVSGLYPLHGDALFFVG